MKAKDIMSKNVVTISPATSIIEIYKLFKKTRYGGVPVVDSNNKILGIVTKAEVLAVFLPDYFDMLGENIMFIEDFGSLDEEFESMPSLELFIAEDIMVKNIIKAEEGSSLLKIVAIMKKTNTRRILIEKDGVLKGIVTRGDICKAFFENGEINKDA